MAASIFIHIRIEIEDVRNLSGAILTRLPAPFGGKCGRSMMHFSAHQYGEQQPNGWTPAINHQYPLTVVFYWTPIPPDEDYHALMKVLAPQIQAAVKQIVASDTDLYAAIYSQLKGDNWHFLV